MQKNIPIVLIILLLFSINLNGQSKANSNSAENNKNRLVKKAFKNYKGNYLIYISKKEFTLYLIRKKNKAILKFKIAYGFNPDRAPKLYEGDMRTPEGFYRIDEVLRLKDPVNSESHKKLKALNDLDLKAEEGFFRFDDPVVDLGKNAYGPMFYRLDYPAGEDRIKYEKAVKEGIVPKDKEGKISGIGFGIAIHGNNYPKSIGNPASAGCIIMNNKDIEKLDPYVKKGMPVVISAE